MPMVIFFSCLDLEQKSSFMDGHYLEFHVEKNNHESPKEGKSRRNFIEFKQTNQRFYHLTI
jgi:hypothetical protein